MLGVSWLRVGAHSALRCIFSKGLWQNWYFRLVGLYDGGLYWVFGGNGKNWVALFGFSDANCILVL